jgi:hypothetical protein
VCRRSNSFAEFTAPDWPALVLISCGLRLGHSSIKTTEIYVAFLTPEEKRVVMFGVQEESLKESQV